MRVAFWYKPNSLENKIRTDILGKELVIRGHKVSYIEDDVITTGEDVIVIDSMSPPKSVADRAITAGSKVVVLDGKDAAADVSISGFINEDADHKGIEYVVFPKLNNVTKYNSSKKSNTVFVSMGDQDKNNFAELVLGVLDKMEINAIVVNNEGQIGFRRKFSRVEVFYEDNSYDAMHECIMAITSGGPELFQALHYGIPTVALAQHEYQNNGINSVNHCCVRAYPDETSLRSSINSLMGSEYYRKNLSDFAKHHVNDNGAAKICDIIEGLKSVEIDTSNNTEY